MKKHINDKVKSCFASFLILFVSATTVKAEGPKTGAFAEIPTLGDTLRASERMVDVAYGKQKYDSQRSQISVRYQRYPFGNGCGYLPRHEYGGYG